VEADSDREPTGREVNVGCGGAWASKRQFDVLAT